MALKIVFKSWRSGAADIVTATWTGLNHAMAFHNRKYLVVRRQCYDCCLYNTWVALRKRVLTEKKCIFLLEKRTRLLVELCIFYNLCVSTPERWDWLPVTLMNSIMLYVVCIIKYYFVQKSTKLNYVRQVQCDQMSQMTYPNCILFESFESQ
jgi:hypothetical protein